MNFQDEKFVKLYVRDTGTWCLWSWETRAVFCFLLRVVDRAGVLDLGSAKRENALSVILRIPPNVAKKALAELLECGSVSINDRGTLLVDHFSEAQTARQNDRLRQEESRAFRRLSAQNHDGVCHTVSHGVTDGHTVSQSVTTRLDETRIGGNMAPDSASPSPTPPLFEKETAKAKAPKREKKEKPTTDPTMRVISDSLCAIFLALRGAPYVWAGAKDGAALASLLSQGQPSIEAHWRHALAHKGFPEVGSVAQMAQHWNLITTQMATLPIRPESEIFY